MSKLVYPFLDSKVLSTEMREEELVQDRQTDRQTDRHSQFKSAPCSHLSLPFWLREV